MFPPKVSAFVRRCCSCFVVSFFWGGKRASFLDFPTLVHLVSVLTCKLSLSHPANPTWKSGMVRISFKKPHRRQKKKKKKEIVQKKKRSKLLNPKLTVHPKNQTGIGLLNIALKQPLPTELSALFMCNILQRRQHVHFAGQASAYDHLQPPFSHSFGFYREKKKNLLSSHLECRLPCISWFAYFRL